MTEPLAPEIKRLRRLSAGELADEVGALKAQLAALDEQLAGYKAEGVRRGLDEADSKLFRLTFTPPGTRSQITASYCAGCLAIRSPTISRARSPPIGSCAALPAKRPSGGWRAMVYPSLSGGPLARHGY